MATHIRKNMTRFLTTTALTAAGVIALSSAAMADNWGDHTYDAGSVDVDVSLPNVTNLHQNTSFVKARGDGDITAGHTVNVFQPGSGSKYVLYDIEGDATQIMGTLNANGQIFIFDQNGVIFGANSSVNVGSIITSTGSIADMDIVDGDGKYTFDNVDTGASIINHGSITVADAGLAAFVAPTVINNGVINAKMGTVALASGNKVTVDLYGDNLVEIALNDKTSDALLDNAGTINAEGGTIVMSAQAAKSAVDNVINVSGVVNASSATVKGGKIILGGGAQGAVNVSGKLNASGTSGGDVKVTGQNVVATDTAEISVDAGQNGDGGNVLVFGNQYAIFNGSITGRGGAQSGKGGFAEISGGESVGFNGLVDMSAANGQNGTLLIDPRVLNIGNGSTNNLLAEIFSGGTTQTVYLNAQALANTLENTNVNLWATEEINTVDDIDLSTWSRRRFIVAGPVIKGITEGDLTLSATEVNIGGDIILGNGNLNVFDIAEGASPLAFGLIDAPFDIAVETLNLNGKIYGRSTVNGPTSIITDDTRINTTADTINVESSDALIQQAISFADATDPATINVAAGTYNESVNVNKSVTLKGAKNGVSGSDAARGTGETIIAPNSPGFHITANNVTVDGFTINNPGGADGYGVWVDGATDTTVSNNVVNNPSVYGLYVTGSTRTTLQNNEINNSSVDSIRVVGGTDTDILGNDLNDSGVNLGVNGIGSGIVLVQTADVLIDDNDITNAARLGVYSGGSSDVVITNNRLDNIGTGTNTSVGDSIGKWAGIQAEGTNNLTITGNNIDRTTGDGINLGGFINPGLNGGITGTIRVSGNAINDAGKDGIAVLNSDNTVIGGLADADGNILTNIDGNGIYSNNSNHIKISRNSVTDSILNNIWADNSTDVTINNNVTSGTAAHAGIALRNVTGASITENAVTNAGYGLYADGNTTAVTAKGNSVTDIDNFLVWNNGAPQTYDASGNYWGTVNQNTILAAMSGSVDFSTYLGFATDMSAAKGFQGDFSDLYVTALGAQVQTGGRINEALGLLENGSLTGANRIIHVMNGTYNENVNIAKSVNLRGFQADFDGRGTRAGAEAIVNGYFLTEANLDGLTINGFTINNQGTPVLGEVASVYLNNNVQNINVINNKFNGQSNVASRGIVTSIAGIDGLLVRYNDFRNLATGVYVNPNSVDVDIRQNNFVDNNVGVSVDGTAQVRNNLFRNNTIEGIGIGGTVTNFVNNDFRNNTQHIAYYNGAGPDILVDNTTGNRFHTNGSFKSTNDMSLDELFALEDAVTHVLDNGTYGRVIFIPGNWYATESTGIQPAIDAADAGDNVYVDDGEYTEQLNIGKNLSLIGSGAFNTTVLNAPEHLALSYTQDGRQVYAIVYAHDAENVNISGFQINGSTNADTFFNDSKRFVGVAYRNAGGTFSENWVKDILTTGNNARSGFAFLGTDKIGSTNSILNIEDNTFSGFQKYGIALADSQMRATVTGNTITGDKANVGTSQSSIFVTSGAKATVGGTDAATDKNTISFTDIGVEFDGAGGNTAQNNTLNNIDYGFVVKNSAGTQLLGNTMTGNSLIGIDILAGSHNTMVDGGSVSHFNTGIRSTNANNVTVQNVVINDILMGNGVEFNGGQNAKILNNFIGYVDNLMTPGSDGNINGNGIYVSGVSGESEIAGNRIVETSGNGVSVNESDDTRILRNVINNIDGAGIYIYGSDDTLVRNNRIGLIGGDENIDDEGILAENVRTIRIINNRIANTENDGIKVTGGELLMVPTIAAIEEETPSFDVVISGNKINHTDEDGIDVEHSGSVRIHNNIVRDVDDNGIEADGYAYESESKFGWGGTMGSRLVVTENRVFDADETGIFLTGYNAMDVKENVVRRVGDDGIAISGFNDADIIKNRIRHAGGDGINVSGGYDWYWGGVNGNARIIENNIRFVEDDGVDVNTLQTARIRDNRIQDTGDDGIHAENIGGGFMLARLLEESEEDSDDLIIANNVIRRAGLYVPEGEGSGDEPTLFAKEIFFEGISGDGIEVVNSGDTRIVGNRINETEKDGIIVWNTGFSDRKPDLADISEFDSFAIPFNGSRVVIRDNVVRNAGQDGIDVTNISDARIIENTVRRSGVNGFLAAGSYNGDILLQGNFFYNNPVGARFESGLIDLTGDTNTFSRGNVGLQFDPSGSMFPEMPEEGPFEMGLKSISFFDPIYGPFGTGLNLVDNTIGTTVFEKYTGEGDLFVELLNGALFAPDMPTVINGLNASYNGFSPALAGGLLSQEEFDAIENRIVHFTDDPTLGLFFFGFAPLSASLTIDQQEDIFRIINGFAPQGGNLNVLITGLPEIPGAPGGGPTGGDIANFLANITPAAGGEGGEPTPDDLNNINPAAGGNQQQASCWGDAVGMAGNGQSVNINYGSGGEDILNGAASCGSSL